MPNDALYTGLAMVAGMLLQIGLSLDRDAWKEPIWPGLMLAVAGAAFGFVPWSVETVYSPARHAMFACALFLFLAVTIFRDRLLPRIQEGTVLIWTCIFVYAIVVAFGPGHRIAIAAMLLSFVMTVFLVLPLSMSFAQKFVAYAWFLLVVTTIAALQFRFADFGWILFGDVPDLGYGRAVLDGMAFAYLGVHLIYLVRLVPIPLWLKLERGALGVWMRKWHSDIKGMVARFSERRVDPVLAVAVVTSLGAVLYWNLLTQAVEPWLLINLALVCTPVYGEVLAVLVRRHKNDKLKRLAGTSS